MINIFKIIKQKKEQRKQEYLKELEEEEKARKECIVLLQQHKIHKHKGIFKHTEKTKLKIKKSKLKQWQKPNFARMMFKAQDRKPTRPENVLINLIKQNNLPFNYVGDGVIWFKGKTHTYNPDFLSKNPKHIIEVFGDYWHRPEIYAEKDKKRIATYSKYGYKTLVIWQHELITNTYGQQLSDIEIINKIKTFIK